MSAVVGTVHVHRFEQGAQFDEHDLQMQEMAEGLTWEQRRRLMRELSRFIYDGGQR